MHFINLMVNYLCRKYGVSIHNFTRKLSRSISYLKFNNTEWYNLNSYCYTKHTQKMVLHRD